MKERLTEGGEKKKIRKTDRKKESEQGRKNKRKTNRQKESPTEWKTQQIERKKDRQRKTDSQLKNKTKETTDYPLVFFLTVCHHQKICLAPPISFRPHPLFVSYLAFRVTASHLRDFINDICILATALCWQVACLFVCFFWMQFKCWWCHLWACTVRPASSLQHMIYYSIWYTFA